MTSCVFGYWLGPCCRSGRSSHLSLVDFLPVGQPGKSGDISSTAEYCSSHSPDLICYFGFILLLVRRGLCIFSWAGRKAVYGLDVAMFVSLIVTWWRCQSTSTCGNLRAPATWRTSSQLEYIQIRNQIPEAGLLASLSNVYFLVWIWSNDKPNATFSAKKDWTPCSIRLHLSTLKCL